MRTNCLKRADLSVVSASTEYRWHVLLVYEDIEADDTDWLPKYQRIWLQVPEGYCQRWLKAFDTVVPVIGRAVAENAETNRCFLAPNHVTRSLAFASQPYNLESPVILVSSRAITPNTS